MSMGTFTTDAILKFNKTYEVTAEWRKNLFSIKRVGIVIDPGDIGHNSDGLFYCEPGSSVYQEFERPPKLKNFEVTTPNLSQDSPWFDNAKFYTQDEFFDWVAEGLRQMEWELHFTEMVKEGEYASVEDAEEAYMEDKWGDLRCIASAKENLIDGYEGDGSMEGFDELGELEDFEELEMEM
jgi:hypothetical protein